MAIRPQLHEPCGVNSGGLPSLFALFPFFARVLATEPSNNAPRDHVSLLNHLFSNSIPRINNLLAPLRRLPSQLSSYPLLTFSGIVLLMTILALIPCSGLAKRKRRRTDAGSHCSDSTNDVSDITGVDAAATDPGLLKKHSTYKSYLVPSTGITYPAIRTFFRPHPQGDKLPSTPTPIPLLVFVHGLGGSVAQFHPLLISLVNSAPCLSIDAPGCGLSKFEPKDWNAYTIDALVQLLAVAIEEHRDKHAGQGVVLIGHSMGCSLAVLLASSTSTHANLLSKHVLGFVGICPRAEPPTEKEVSLFRKLLYIPGPIFDLWRAWDRRGGTESGSVLRFTGPNAEMETKRLQVRFNEQSKTPVWRRMASGILPKYVNGISRGGLPGREVWSGLQIPVFLFAGEVDHVTPASEVEKIVEFLGKASQTEEKGNAESIPDAAAPIDSSGLKEAHSVNSAPSHEPSNAIKVMPVDSSIIPTEESTGIGDDLDASLAQSPQSESSLASAQPVKLVVKTTILPAPASHTLLYAPSTSRTIAGLVQTFLARHVDPRLSLSWQLRHLSTEGKWDVKNLEKWSAVAPVGKRIGGVFRAMKTLREVDPLHCPKVFVREWGPSAASNGTMSASQDSVNTRSTATRKEKELWQHYESDTGPRIGAIVDISHETPVYDPRGLEAGGVQYHKFPTVSKVPPTVDEVKGFIDLVDSLRRQLNPPLQTPQVGDDTQQQRHRESSPKQGQSEGQGQVESQERNLTVGVHCHYGFNRTGFFIVCYLVERLGYSLQAAIDEFERTRPPGIKHDHFVDTLFVRYCVGLRRAPTL